MSLTIKVNIISNIFTIYIRIIVFKYLPKGRALMKMYRVVPLNEKRDSCLITFPVLSNEG